MINNPSSNIINYNNTNTLRQSNRPIENANQMIEPQSNRLGFDTANTNNINISINDELSSRNQINLRQNLRNNSSSNAIPSGGQQEIVNFEDMMLCPRCNCAFISQSEYTSHLSYCGVLRNNHLMHNSLSEIYHLVQTLNRQLQMDSRLAMLSFLGQEEPEEIYDLIDWEYKITDEGVVWVSKGKVHITSKI